jgi:hypothetical protein
MNSYLRSSVKYFYLYERIFNHGVKNYFAVLPKTSRGFMCFSIIPEAFHYSPN